MCFRIQAGSNLMSPCKLGRHGTGARTLATKLPAPHCAHTLFGFWKMLFIFREREREGEREGEKHWCVRDTSIGCLLHATYWGPGLQPRHVPWLRIKPVTFQFTDWHLIHWATPAKTVLIPFNWLSLMAARVIFLKCKSDTLTWFPIYQINC